MKILRGVFSIIQSDLHYRKVSLKSSTLHSQHLLTVSFLLTGVRLPQVDGPHQWLHA